MSTLLRDIISTIIGGIGLTTLTFIAKHFIPFLKTLSETTFIWMSLVETFLIGCLVTFVFIREKRYKKYISQPISAKKSDYKICNGIAFDLSTKNPHCVICYNPLYKVRLNMLYCSKCKVNIDMYFNNSPALIAWAKKWR